MRGMWPLRGLPRAVLKERYGFEPSSEWVTRMQHAAVRFADGGSGRSSAKVGWC